MFVRHLESVPLPQKPGLVLALSRKDKSYFLLSSTFIERLISKMLKCITSPTDKEIRIFSKFKRLAQGTELSNWEFYHSTDLDAAVPADIHRFFQHIDSESTLEYSCVKEGRSIYRVEHKFTNLPIFVVDKAITTKEAILRKAVAQLTKYYTQPAASFAPIVEDFLGRLGQFVEIFEQTAKRTAYDLRDVSFEKVDDSASYATHASRASDLNHDALSLWVIGEKGKA